MSKTKGVKTNKRDIFVFAIIFISVFLFLSLFTFDIPAVLAKIALNTTISTSPNQTNVGNYSGHSIYNASGLGNNDLIFFNVSFDNVTDVTSPTNMTILYAHTQAGPWLFFANISLNTSQTAGTNNAFPHNLTVSLQPGNTTAYAWGFVNITSAPENRTLHFNVTLSNSSTYYPLNGSQNIFYNVTIHNTPPQVSPANISLGHGKSGNGHNWSKTKITDAIDFNITVHWNLFNISTIYLNITNGSVGTQNRSYNFTYNNGNYGAAQNGLIINASSLEISPTIFRSNASWNITSYPDGVYSFELTVVNDSFGVNSTALAVAGGLNNNTNRWYLFNITLDSVAPIVNTSNISQAVKGGNYSSAANGTIINISIQVDDFSSGINEVIFNISLGNGTQNGTLTASKSGTNYWNASIDTRQYRSGAYNITAIVNDSAGNVLAYALLPVLTNVSLDNVAPALSSFTCTPSPLDEGDTVTCACSGVDAVTMVKTTSFTAKPSTSSTGTFTESCTLADFAGNEKIYTTTYTVSGIGSVGGSGGGGGGGGSSTSVPSIAAGSTIAVSETQVTSSTGYRAQFSENSKAEVRITPSTGSITEKHTLTITNIKSNSATVRIESEPITLTLNTGEVKKVDIDADNVYDLSVQLNGISNNRADISIKQIKENISGVPVSEGEIQGEGEKVDDSKTAQGTGSSKSTITATIIGIILVIVIVIVVVVIFNKNKRR